MLGMSHSGSNDAEWTGTIVGGKTSLQSITQIGNKDIRDMSEEIDECSRSNTLEDERNHSVVSVKSAEGI